jgi:branched-chain amino acid aminotransferase
MNTYVNFNGKIIPADRAILTADNRSFRYGDGLFETIKVVNGRIILENYHFERFIKGAAILQFDPAPHLSLKVLAAHMLELCERNGHLQHARVRMVLFRGNGGLFDKPDNFPNYIIQTWALPVMEGGTTYPDNQGNQWVIGIFPDARKSCDLYANLKSNNYQASVQAAIYARRHQLNDCLILNSYGRIAESSIANLFYCKNGRIFTPPLSEGCVAGVMRRFILEEAEKAGLDLVEQVTTAEDLESADEVFLTNIIQGIRRVSGFRNVSGGDQSDVNYNNWQISTHCQELIQKKL